MRRASPPADHASLDHEGAVLEDGFEVAACCDSLSALQLGESVRGGGGLAAFLVGGEGLKRCLAAEQDREGDRVRGHARKLARRQGHSNRCRAEGSPSLTLGGQRGRLAAMLRPFITLLVCLSFSACSDSSSDESDGSTGALPADKVLGFGEPCFVDEPFSQAPSVDGCKDGLICTMNDFGCNKGVCTVACVHSPGAENPCEPIAGVATGCYYMYTNGPQACSLDCDSSTVCPNIFSQPLVCIASSCRVPVEECGVESGET